MTEKKKVTMREVAAAAGVTIGTVSHVINGTASISEKTKEEVWRVIREMGYSPNPMAQYMRSKKSRILGLFVPDLTNIFFAKTASVFANLAYENGYTVLILENAYSEEKEKQNVQILVRNRADAAVVLCGFLNHSHEKELLEKKIQIVYADCESDCKEIPSISFENRTVMNQIADYAKERGYSSIGYFSEPLALDNLSTRFASYCEALEKNGIPYRKEHIFLSEKLSKDHLKNGYIYMKEILMSHKIEELPKLWLTSSDLSAIGAIRALKEAGLRIPEDMAVIGWDDLEISESIFPSLTTVHQDQTELGKKSWELLMKLLKDETWNHVVLEQNMIFRDSCPEK